MQQHLRRTLVMIVALAGLLLAPPPVGAVGLANKKIVGLRFRDTLNNRDIGDAELKNKVVVLYFWSPKNQESIQGFKPLVDMQNDLDKLWAETQKAAAAKKEPVTDLPLMIVAYNVGGPSGEALKIARQLDARWVYANGPPADQDQLMKFADAEEKDLPLANVQDKGGVFKWSGKSSAAPAEVAKMLGIQIPKREEQPDNPVGASATLREALRLMEEKGEFVKPMELVAKVPDKLLSDPSVMPYAAALLVRIRIDREHSKQIEKALSGNPEASRKLKSMSGAVLAALQAAAQRGDTASGGASPGAAALKTPVDRSVLAAKKLEDADRYHQGNEPDKAYPLYKEITDHYANSPAAVFAAQHIAEYEKDPQFMKKAKDGDTQRKAQSLLMAARGLRDGGRHVEARGMYAKLLESYPDTRAASEASEDLKQLN